MNPCTRTIRSTFLLAALGLAIASSAQRTATITTKVPPPGKVYASGGLEFIFSTPLLDVNGSDRGAIVRFAPVFNSIAMSNYDFSENAGMFLGLSIRNHGFIYAAPNGDRFKFRTYNVGIPVGIKLGSMNNSLLFLGYELELPFNYRERKFVDDRRVDRFSVWFSDRNSTFFHSVFIGTQGPKGSALTLRYYINNFHNTGFTTRVDNVETQPYAGFNANVLSLALGFGIFDGRYTHIQRTPAPTDTKAYMRSNKDRRHGGS
jgi:hypothetical protein